MVAGVIAMGRNRAVRLNMAFAECQFAEAMSASQQKCRFCHDAMTMIMPYRYICSGAWARRKGFSGGSPRRGYCGNW